MSKIELNNEMEIKEPTHRLSRRRMLQMGAAAAFGAASLPRIVRGGAPYADPKSNPAFRPPTATPARPWEKAYRDWPRPGRPGEDYTPAHMPDGVTLDYKVVDGVKVFHLIAEPIVHELAPGLVINAWGYNGRTPGPMIEVVEGDRVRIYVTNRLPAPTTIHWHAVILPCGMDGVAGLTQPPIPVGETFVYEFIFNAAGTFMYHPHFDNMTQEGMGLTGLIVVHPRDPARRPDRDFALMLHEWFIEGGTSTPDPFEMTDFNVLTINGKAHPGTSPLVAQLGDQVQIRIGNLSAMHHHPIHLHGYAFRITATDGGPIPESAQWPETTVLVSVGQTRNIEFLADNPGDWMMHCHMTHHTMNQMGHEFQNMIGVDTSGVDEKIRKLIPGFMMMGTTGMEDMAHMNMPVPQNSIPMLGMQGQFGPTVMGGMATTLKVRERVSGYDDPGDYDFPEGTLVRTASAAELDRDGIEIPPARPRGVIAPASARPATAPGHPESPPSARPGATPGSGSTTQSHGRHH